MTTFDPWYGPDEAHPHSCFGPGNCVHCDREYRHEENWKHEEREHDPATCALCDPEYDGQPNSARDGADT